MTAFYDDMAATATELLTEFGKALQLRRASAGTYDPVTGTTTGATITYADIIGIFIRITQDYAATNEVQQGDRLMVIGPSVAPQMTDKVVVGASALTIVNIVPINPAGTPLAYKLQVRGTVDASGDGGSFSSTPASRTLDGGDFG